jgi:cell division protein FtsL
MWFLVTALLITALFTVYVRHQHRIAYTAYQAEESRRDALNDEWGQLLIEENLWAFPHRIEKDASSQLGMRLPTTGEIVFVEPVDAHVREAHASR